ncbi:MAG: SemiSWEET family sugar transporter [Gammaproteobacteria bacterium]
MNTKLNFDNFPQYIGFLGAFCTTISFIPQAVKIQRTQNTSDISLPMWVLLSLGICCWLTYGILRGDLPLIIANIVTLAISLFILSRKIKYG